ncbi:MAG: glycoside hydrolase family 30 protein [Phaeodactylibacter sp.]|nr:glycoside hydrolase family 30 protein [Phaeodactylibacter sp.]MCB9296002.1 glycoside hydrolase family 30 protein [Lewinellaceae bacterium]
MKIRILIPLLLSNAIVFGQKASGPGYAGEGEKVSVVTTAENSPFRLTPTATLSFAPFGQPFEDQPCVFVDPSQTFQAFAGIGGALTDASAETFAKLPPGQQEELLRAYYDPEQGIGYTLARTNINSCDFSSGMYTYVDEGDAELHTFSIGPDERFKIPFIKKAMAAAGGQLDLFVSPWSPPAWMKDNNSMLQGGKLKPEHYGTWANYFVKFIQAYEKAGIPVWGLSVQNEPMAKQTWESCIYTAQEEADFIKNHLGPALEKKGFSDKKLIAWDHNRDLLYQRAATYLSDPETARYIWGVGFHWYESWTGGHQYENVKRVAEAFPEKKLLLTEACNYPFSWETFGDWSWGERYGENMIHDFNNGAVAWTDWNVLLDETGGPNHVGNFCFAPVHARTEDGTLHYMNSYYYIGHFSKFIRPGARRIACSSSRAQLLATAFLNPDGSVAVVVMNPTEEKIGYRLYVGGQAVEAESLPHSIATLIY